MSEGLWPIELLVAASVMPVIVGAFSRSLPKATLGAALMMALAVFVAYVAPGYLGNLATPDESLETIIMRSLAVIPATTFFATIGYGVRLGLLRIFSILAQRAAGRRLEP